MDRSPTAPFYEPLPPSAGPAITGPDAVHRAAYRGAVTGADAYRATRQAVQRLDDVLRTGNRFQRIDPLREIAFVAVGDAAVSQAMAVLDSLGERVTQGFLAGPLKPPPEVPFRSVVAPTAPPGRPAGTGVAASALELAGGLGEHDLLLVLVSPGSLGLLSEPPKGFGADAWRATVERWGSAGATGTELDLLVRLLSGGAAAGRLADAASGAQVETLVVDRGEGGVAVGGGPTRSPTDVERDRARATLERIGEWGRLDATVRASIGRDSSRRDPLPRSVQRPVVVAGPAEALRGAADAVGEKKWMPRLASIRLSGGPEAAAREFSASVEKLLIDQLPLARAAGREGIVAFGATYLEEVEGTDERPGMVRFLRTAQSLLTRRSVTVSIARTSGADSGEPPGYVVGATGMARGMAMRSGVTSVGELVVAQVPADVPPR